MWESLSYIDGAVAALDAYSMPLCKTIGVPPDQLRFLLLTLLSFPVGWFQLSFLNGSTTARHVFNTALGMLYCFLIVGSGALHMHIVAICCYALMIYLPRGVAPRAVAVFSMLYLSCGHIYRMYVDYMGWRVDFTMPLMMLTVKVYTCAFDYDDGLRPAKELKEENLKSRLERAPSLLEYFSYLFFYAGVIAGPPYEMKPYLQFVDRSMFKRSENAKVIIPSSVLPSLQKIAQALLIYVGVFLSSLLPIPYAVTDEFLAKPFWFRFLYLWVGVALVRFRYYFAWTLAEGGCIASGIGYNGIDEKGRVKWNRVNNADVLGVELGQNLKQYTDSWNKGTNHWLKNYVYLRGPSTTKFMSARTFNNVMTKFVSAFWHGFYPGYYLFFLSAALLLRASNGIRSRFRHHFVVVENGVERGKYPLKFGYDFFGWMLTSFAMNYLGLSFVLLSFENSLKVWRSLYFAGHIIIVSIVILDKLFKPKRKHAAGAATTPGKKVQ